VISEVIAGILFYLLAQPEGMVNSILRWGGLAGLTQDWFGDLGLVLPTLFVVITWKYFGFHMIIFLAGLQGIPREVEEAALIDGASRWQAFRGVTLPLLGPTIRVSVFLSIIGALQLFDLVWATTRGGPVHASDTMATYMVDFGFQRSQMGYGSAVSVLLFTMCLVFALLYVGFVMRRDTDGAITRIGG
jgi:raffinose/stachyose/melibiose transport system permease protein